MSILFVWKENRWAVPSPWTQSDGLGGVYGGKNLWSLEWERIGIVDGWQWWWWEKYGCDEWNQLGNEVRLHVCTSVPSHDHQVRQAGLPVMMMMIVRESVKGWLTSKMQGNAVMWGGASSKQCGDWMIIRADQCTWQLYEKESYLSCSVRETYMSIRVRWETPLRFDACNVYVNKTDVGLHNSTPLVLINAVPSIHETTASQEGRSGVHA